mmetsp:Transcript_18672/g.22367  ORF Transcript_18672/g.22367 Transcript_18672/m.22367 type:complete len:164 (-) Transcript_18672:445-936(-)|eukprot:CAMPEP_0197852074 /NCGR_PEP_ID=MMETSP1438-20131217/19595_1 /TAXON_ID=1461541 /ORGANISM="Pterosperma sp., Strain CCMP1384" /LENGTH=163 /DNA_ID=CAMNT_0043465933 /DNA_START=79 /DNA_END=570 /DNA_ORIENTATION=+
MPTASDPQYYQFTKQLVDIAPCLVYPIDTTEAYVDKLAQLGLKLVEVYSEGWGPCYSVLPTLKRIKLEKDPDPSCFQYNPCKCDDIEQLQQYFGQSKPLFLFYRNGKLVEKVEGPNTPALERAILNHMPMNPEADDLEENPFLQAKKAAEEAAKQAAKEAAAA